MSNLFWKKSFIRLALKVTDMAGILKNVAISESFWIDALRKTRNAESNVYGICVSGVAPLAATQVSHKIVPTRRHVAEFGVPTYPAKHNSAAAGYS